MTAYVVEGPPALLVREVLEEAEQLEERPLASTLDTGFLEGVIAALRWVQGDGPEPNLPVPTDTCTQCDGAGRREGPGDTALRCEDCIDGVAR